MGGVGLRGGLIGHSRGVIEWDRMYCLYSVMRCDLCCMVEIVIDR